MISPVLRTTIPALALVLAKVCVADAIEWPRLGQPAVVVPGSLLEVGAREDGELSLERDGGSTPLETNWSQSNGATRLGRSVLPEGTPPGRYNLQLEGASGVSSRPASVHVLDEWPEEYTIAVAAGIPSAGGGATQPALPADLAANLNAAPVHMAIVLGPLTRGASEADYQALETLLLETKAPVFLCPEYSDLHGDAFYKRFGRAVHIAVFGKDSFLFLGAGLDAEEPRSHERLGEAHLLRRAQRASQWSVGVTGGYGLGWDLRSQIALLVDDPLDFLVAGSIPPGLGATVPWGKTAFVLAPDAPKGQIVLFDVTAAGIRPHKEPEAAADTQEVTPEG